MKWRRKASAFGPLCPFLFYRAEADHIASLGVCNALPQNRHFPGLAWAGRNFDFPFFSSHLFSELLLSATLQAYSDKV